MKYNFLRFFILLTFFTLIVTKGYSIHIAGGEFEYKYLSQSIAADGRVLYKYHVKYHYYGKCAGGATTPSFTPHQRTLGITSFFPGPIIDHTTGEYVIMTNGTETIDLRDQLWLEVPTNVYPTVCACENGGQDGYREFIFEGDIDIHEGDWVFKMNDYNRNGVTSSGVEHFYVEATLHLTPTTTNSSVVFANTLVIFPVINQPFTYNFGASDADGDNLTYELVHPKTSPGGYLNYYPTYSETEPFGLGTGSISIDPTTGLLTGISNITQVVVMAVLVKEYKGTQLVGTVTRDIQIKVVAGNNINPALSSIDNSGFYSIQAGSGIANCFHIFGSDANAGQQVTLTSNDLATIIPTATLSTVGSPGTNPDATICWTPTIADIGQTFCFTMIAEDNNCSVGIPPTPNGITIQTYCISVVPGVPPSCVNCIGSFQPEEGDYILSAWVKQGELVNPNILTYTNPGIEIGFPSFPGIIYTATGDIIDGWQRIEQPFNLPPLSSSIIIKLECASGNCYFDDIRIFPKDGSMKSYVYDPKNLRLVAELDERNYATMYEYDEEGKLVRVKKETERGVMTIKENKNSTTKK